MTPWSSRQKPPPPSVIEKVIPVEVPVLTETKRLLARGEYGEALRGAYARVIVDVQRAYAKPFPPGWTTGEILARGTTAPEMLPLLEFLGRLTELYEPVRFNPVGAPPQPDELIAILQSLYAARPMWSLYLEPRAPAVEGPAGSTTGSRSAAPTGDSS